MVETTIVHLILQRGGAMCKGKRLVQDDPNDILLANFKPLDSELRQPPNYSAFKQKVSLVPLKAGLRGQLWFRHVIKNLSKI